MDLNKNDGNFNPSIKGIESGKTSQVDGMNGILQEFINNDNYLNDNKIGNDKKSSVISSLSEDTVATSKAVKTAYDKGVDGLNKANEVSVVANNSMDFVNDNNGLPRNLNIKDIQDVGSKDKNHCYGDRNMPNTLWKIKDNYGGTSTTTQVNDASIFERYDNKELLGKLQNLVKIKNEIKTSVSFRNSMIVYGSTTLREFKDSDLIYLVCDANNAGEAYAYIAPVSLFRNGPAGTRVTLEMLDASTSNVKVSLGVETSTGNLTLVCSDSGDMYLRYACVISSLI